MAMMHFMIRRFARAQQSSDGFSSSLSDCARGAMTRASRTRGCSLIAPRSSYAEGPLAAPGIRFPLGVLAIAIVADLRRPINAVQQAGGRSEAR